jgi:hexosaminidase
VPRSFSNYSWIAHAVLAAVLVASPAAANDLSVMPLPASVQLSAGALPLGPGFRVSKGEYRDPIIDGGVDRLIARLRAKTGLDIKFASGAEAESTLLVRCKGPDSKFLSTDADETYRLEITPAKAVLEANGPAGILRGLVTFAQLVRPSSTGFEAPSVAITDRPRFPWRGLMIDTSRHFIPFDALLRTLDAMEWVKLDVLHLHLTDAQGFRVESKVYPKLHKLGSDGDFYTQEQIRELVAKARDRGIRVVPEFDVPGHSQSWLVGYPELASKAGPYRLGNDPEAMNAVLNPADDAVYTFLDHLFGEMAGLFPDAYFHIGADEVNGIEWQANPTIQAFAKQHGLEDRHALLGYFTRRAFGIVREHGKIPIGWDEILAGDPPPGTVVQTWRSSQLVAQSTSRRLPTIVSSGYYLDYMLPSSFHYAKDPTDPAAVGLDEQMWKRLKGTPLETYFPENAVIVPGSKLSEEQQKHILGGEAAIWTELVTGEMVEGRIWPRAAAIAERLWSPIGVRDEDSMYARLAWVDRDLQLIGSRHRENPVQMLARLSDTGYGALAPVADALEPVKYVGRLAVRMRNPAAAETALNRVVDALPPESMGAVAFRTRVQRLLSGDDSAEAAVRLQLSLWRDNHSALQATAAHSFAVREILPVTEDLGLLSATALDALDYRAHRKPAAAAWSDRAKAIIAKHKQLSASSGDILSSFLSPSLPPGEVIIAVLPSLEALINSAEARP